MLSEIEMHKAALRKLIDIKGKDYVLKNKNNLYPCWSVNGTVAQISISLSDGNDDSIFDSEGNIVIDETKKAKEEFKFEVNLKTGECKYIE
ncbi:MAG: hypothetical protein IJY55_00490 [Clostridia bacterium]|nr:hypothetical protein [Clostridia bacterium]